MTPVSACVAAPPRGGAGLPCTTSRCDHGPSGVDPWRGVVPRAIPRAESRRWVRHRSRMPHPGTALAPCLPVHSHRQAAPRDSTVLIVPQDLRSLRCVALPYATAPSETLSRLQSSVATDPEVLLRPLCWCGAQPCFLKRAGSVVPACVSIGLASGCSYGEAAQLKGEDDDSHHDSAKCTEGEEQSECDASEPRGAGLSFLSR